MHLVVWATRDESTEIQDLDDHWSAHDNLPEAEDEYARVLKLKNLYSASLCKPIRSTDYM